MGIAKKTDGRYLVGIGVDSVNDYRGSAAYRDIYIQLTSSGATAKSEEYLTFLKDYGFHANASGEPIMPPSVNVWISNNGVTTAVEADDVSIDGNNYTICGIKWNGSAWDYTNAGQGSGGGGSSLPSYSSSDIGKALTVGEGSETVQTVIVPEQSVTLTDGGSAWVSIFGEDSGVNSSFFENASVGDKCNISLDGATAVESTGVEFAGNVLFPIGDFYLGYSSLFGGVGVASLIEPTEKTHTISATALIPNVELNWAEIFSIPHIKEGGNGTYQYNNKTYGSYQDCSEMIKRYPVVILEKGINNWISCGFVDEYTDSRHAAQYCFNVWNNGSVSLLKLGFEIDL